MTSASDLAAEQFVSLTTYRRSGEPVATPVWIVALSDGRLGFWTAMGTGKTKRLPHDPRVLLQPCSRLGAVRPGSTATAGTATVVRSGRAFDEVHGRVREKYGLMTRVTGLLHRVGPGRRGLTYADSVVLVSLDPTSPAG